MEELLHEVAVGCTKGSTCTILAERSIKQRQEQIATVEQQLKVKGYTPLKVHHIKGSPVQKPHLCALPLSTYDKIFLLGDVPGSLAQGPLGQHGARITADGKTVASILLLQEQFRGLGIKCPQMVPEILGSNTAEMLDKMGIHDYVDSNGLVSRILACVSEAPISLTIIKALLSGKRATFRVRRLSHYLPEGAPLPDEVTFWDVACIVRRASDDLVIAWSARGAGGQPAGPWILNPTNKHCEVKWEHTDRLVVLSAEPRQ